MNAKVWLNHLLFDGTKKYLLPLVWLLHPLETTITSRHKGALFKPLLPLKAAALREKEEERKGGKKKETKADMDPRTTWGGELGWQRQKESEKEKGERYTEGWRWGGSIGVQWAVRRVHSPPSKHSVPPRIIALTRAANAVTTDAKLTSQLHYSAGGVYRPATPKGSRWPAKNINCF